MKKKYLLLLLIPGFLYGGYRLYNLWQEYSEHLQQQDYVATDTASPNVTVLRDSFLINYQNNKRSIHVYLPPDYDSSGTKRYPVMYFLDGESSFNDLENNGPEWEIDEVINAAAIAGDSTAIVIGIEQAEDRDAEYTPWTNEDNPKAHGERFGQWLTTEFKSWVDSTYRTKPAAAYTSIGGISRSGMMAYYLIMAHPETYGKALVQSPSMWVDHDRLMAMELSPAQLQDKQIFVTVGEREGGPMVPHAKEIYEKFKQAGMDQDHLLLEIIEDESHWHMTWRKSFAKAWPWLSWK